MGVKEVGSVPFSMKVDCGFIRVASAEGDTSERVEVGGPSRKEKDGPEHCSAGIGGDADDLLPSSRMAQTQEVVAMFAWQQVRCCLQG
jgi:hypothetical protein